MNRWNRNLIAVTSVGLLCATQGCELAVQLDRSLVDVGDDAGCTICSAPIEGEVGNDAAADDEGATDAAPADAALADAALADAALADAALADVSTIDSSIDAAR